MSATLPVGHTIAGRYQIAHFLGAGDLCEVYDVRDLTTGYAYALKLFPDEFARVPQAWEAYQSESTEAAQLGLHTIAKVYEYAIEPSYARPYALGEYIMFPSLAQIIQQNGPMSLQELTGVFGVLLPSLHTAHQAGVFHLALKPTNVFLDKNTGENCQVRISDFGVAAGRLLSPPPPGWPATPGWLSAEQADPSSKPTATMDIYTLGLLAFFILTGKSPFRSCQTEGEPDLSLLWAEMTAPLPKASHRARELGTMISPTLDPWFERALAVSPAQRFASLPEMLDALPKQQGQLGSSRTMQPGPLDNPVPPPSGGIIPGAPPAFGSNRPATGTFDGLLEDVEELEIDDDAATVVAMPDMLQGPAAPEQHGVRPAAGMPPPAPSAASPAAGAPPAPPPAPMAAGQIGPPTVKPPITKHKLFLPAAIGAVVVVLALVTVAIVLIFSGPSAQQASHEASTASASAAKSAPTNTPSAQPSASSSPSVTDAGATEDAAEPQEAAPDDALIKLSCSPASCDKVICDRKLVKEPSEGVRLKTGRHRCKVTKKGYYGKTKTIKVEAGRDDEITFELKKIRHIAGPRRIPRPAKTCGTFLNPCK